MRKQGSVSWRKLRQHTTARRKQGVSSSDDHGFLVFAKGAAQRIRNFADSGISFDGPENGRQKIFILRSAPPQFRDSPPALVPVTPPPPRFRPLDLPPL